MNNLHTTGIRMDGTAFELPPKRLRTHGIVVGMTGSGKTGFSVTLLESLIAQNVPIIAIDPKGDLTNLALIFDELSKENFAPWVPEDKDAGVVAESWKSGLERNGIDSETIQRLRQKMCVHLYTPGRMTGTAINLLAAPEQAADIGEESKSELIRSFVSGIFTLLDKDIDPINDPDHILVSAILHHLSQDGLNFSLESLIPAIMNPPFDKVGFFPVDTVCPEKERMALAIALNNLLASPAFAAWRTGQPLSIARLMKRTDGRVPVSIFTLAHLTDSQRQFFLSILLSQILAYTRSQPGSEDLEGLLFFDEVAGYLPPAPKNPVTKDPILTLMKQSRSVGFGVVLATQNPIDLDYKAISNAGLWCIGRLQTKQDRDRLLQGMGRPDLDDVIQELKPRQFLIQHPKLDAPEVISSRHAIAYLRGPITEREYPKLFERHLVEHPSDGHILSSQEDQETQDEEIPTASVAAAQVQQVVPLSPIAYSYMSPQDVYRKERENVFGTKPQTPAEQMERIYQPALRAEIDLRFDDRSGDFVIEEKHHFIMFPMAEGRAWRSIDLSDCVLSDEPQADYPYQALPVELDEKGEIEGAEVELVEWLYGHASRTQWIQKDLKIRSRGDESRAQFEKRVESAYERVHQQELRELYERFTSRQKSLKAKLKTAEDRLEDHNMDLQDRKSERLMDVGETLLGVFMGRKRSMKSSVRSHNRVGKAEQRVLQAQDKVDDIESEIQALGAELKSAMEQLERERHEVMSAIEEKDIRIDKSDIRLKNVKLVWIPVVKA